MLTRPATTRSVCTIAGPQVSHCSLTRPTCQAPFSLTAPPRASQLAACPTSIRARVLVSGHPLMCRTACHCCPPRPPIGHRGATPRLPRSDKGHKDNATASIAQSLRPPHFLDHSTPLAATVVPLAPLRRAPPTGCIL
jgi:hypothetical protein